MPTIYEIGKTIKQTKNGSVGTNAKSIVHGLKPQPVALGPGLHTLSPAQALALEVPTLARDNGGFAGFQRPVVPGHARKIARFLVVGGDMPAIEVSLVDDGRALVTDGQHRLVAAVIAGVPVRAVFSQRTEEEAQALFANQGKARGINPNVLILASADPYGKYVQAACAHPDHPWGPLVASKATDSRISAKQMFDAIATYSANRLGQNQSPAAESFDEHICDELAALFTAFGTKQTNPTAYRVTAIRAIAEAAVLVIRRNGNSREDIDRWKRHMPAFQFALYQHIRRSSELTDALVDHWNKRLSAAKRVAR